MNISANDKTVYRRKYVFWGVLLAVFIMISLLTLALFPPKHQRAIDPEIAAIEPFLKDWAKEEILAELANREILKFRTNDRISLPDEQGVRFICGTVVVKTDGGEEEKLLWVFRFSKDKDGTWIRRRGVDLIHSRQTSEN